MNYDELTRTTPIYQSPQAERPMLCLSIIWHPDHSRIGEQCIMVHDSLDLARYQPLFCKPGKDGLGLGHDGISRQATHLVRNPDDSLTVQASASKMVLEINGAAVLGTQQLSSEQIEQGVIVVLARAVVLCLHFMHCLPRHNPVAGLIGVGSAAIKMRDQIIQVAPTNATVLLLGETGTGKEVAACAIHALSQRARQILVSVNMAALNESLAAADLFGAAKGAYTGAQNSRGGFFAQAQDATLFLDEIGNAPAVVQPMLLRVLEKGDYRPLGAQADVRSNARIIAATDQDLYGGGFNPALLRRLEGFTIAIPPLRERREDIGLLILHLMQADDLPGKGAVELPAPLVAQLATYDWPGNIRQLRHVVRRLTLALSTAEMPTLADLLESGAARPARSGRDMDVPLSTATATAPAPAQVAPLPALPHEPAPVPRRHYRRPADLSNADVLAALDNNDWMIQGAATELGISRPSLYKLLDQHPHIRRADQIDAEEIQRVLAEVAGDVDACAARLKTPAESLRRRLVQLRTGL
ncbi:sigma 54-interacting transcriptional regulator [Undibacterium sp. JH2W]|uniref:sigma 54-interacting transcriptional regulator n=1 Tax=Undibacterium sp. JH2W TaxID=3413037 RepID=UPI003BF3E455